ncbi:MAG: hypothetical protein GQE15_21310 [Archangiaceae bacterium]|nr:hypothetical protein [Archangiaceae bacterium]
MIALLSSVVLAGVGPVTLSAPVTAKNGATVRELKFRDTAGEHVVRFELSRVTTKTVDELEQKTRTLKVSHRVGAKELWSAKDFVETCPFDLLLEVVEGSVEVTDLNDDGMAEVSFAYLLACRSDVSPASAKLLLYEGAAKYALRGSAQDMGGGGEFTADPAFEKAPKGFRAFAEAKWKRLLVDAYAKP